MSWKWSGWDFPLGIFTGGIGTAIHGGFSASEAFGKQAGNSLSSYGSENKGVNIEDLVKMIQSEREYNSAEAEKNRQWQEQMSNTSVQRAVKDIEASGLNPWLALQGSSAVGASTGSGDSGSSSSASAVASVLGNALNNQTSVMNNVIKQIVSLVSSAMKIASSAG